MFFVFTISTENIKTKNQRVEEIIERIAQGGRNAMGELYDLIKTDVFAYALSKTGNKPDAEDITQDTFVQIYKNARLYTPKGKPMAWVITIELNLIRRRFQLNQRSTNLDESYRNLSSGEDFTQSVVHNAFLQELLSSLNQEEREIITLHAVSGLKHREIAKLLDKPLSTILSRYNRAVKKLSLINDGE